jgi:hypothetical protein
MESIRAIATFIKLMGFPFTIEKSICVLDTFVYDLNIYFFQLVTKVVSFQFNCKNNPKIGCTPI